MNTISVPGIGIEPFTVDPVAFTIPIGEGIDIMWYAILVSLGFLVAFLHVCYRSRLEGFIIDDLLDYMIFVMIFGVLGARLYYVVMEPDRFKNFLEILNLRTGGLGIYGGIIGGILAIIGVSIVKKKNVWQVLDMAGPGLMIAQALGRWGNFFNGEAYGYQVPEDSPLYFIRMGLLPNMDSTTTMYYYHPTFLYESMWNVLGFILITLTYKKKKFNGQIAWSYIAWYGLGRMFIEGLRTDSLYLFGTSIRTSQAVAFLSFLLAVGMLIFHFVRSTRAKKEGLPYQPVFSCGSTLRTENEEKPTKETENASESTMDDEPKNENNASETTEQGE